MSVNKLLSTASVGITSVSLLITSIGLAHVLVTSRGLDMLMHELEGWVRSLAYYVAIILLTTATVLYLERKKQ